MPGQGPFRLPAPEANGFLWPLLAQAILMHPRVPDSTSLALRRALMVPTVVLAATAPVRYPFSPSTCVGLAFPWSVAGPYLVMRTIVMGLVTDRTPYVVVGADQEGALRLQRGKVDPAARKAALEKLREDRKQDTLWEVLCWGVQLLWSFQGVGWAWGKGLAHSARRTHSSDFTFLVSSLWHAFRLHLGCIAAIATVIIPRTTLATLLYNFAHPVLPYAASDIVARWIGILSLGFAFFFAMQSGNIAIAIVFMVANKLLRALPLPASLTPAPFDRRLFPLAFDRPWSPRGVSGFWKGQWHSFFRREFLVLGYEPAYQLLGGGRLGQAGGIMAVFALSAWLHEGALYLATYRHPPAPLPFLIQWGGVLYFLLQGVGIILEDGFSRALGRKLPRSAAFIWGWIVVGGAGFLAYDSWVERGLLDNLAEIQEWELIRFFVLPLNLAPRGAFTNAVGPLQVSPVRLP